MAKPIIGIIGNAHLINDEYPVQAVGVSNIEAVADLTGAIPLMVPAIPRVGAISDLIEACSGFVFTGGRVSLSGDDARSFFGLYSDWFTFSVTPRQKGPARP